MKKGSINSHLSPYSITRKRRTTINHAFASAIAPVDKYDEARVSEALQVLGQADPDGELSCVYCDSPAETWDHLVGLVEKAELRGFGHQVGNLVPCCRYCNSRKGAKAWERYLREVQRDEQSFQIRQERIAAYLQRYASPVSIKRRAESSPEEWARYNRVKVRILELMEEADEIAEKLRAAGAD